MLFLREYNKQADFNVLIHNMHINKYIYSCLICYNSAPHTEAGPPPLGSPLKPTSILYSRRNSIATIGLGGAHFLSLPAMCHFLCDMLVLERGIQGMVGA